MMLQSATTVGRVRGFPVLAGLLKLLMSAVLASAAWAEESSPLPRMPRVRASDDGKSFVVGESAQTFVPWGFNYLGQFERLAEDDWDSPTGWKRIEDDFREMHDLGANVVRWHLQFETYMKGPDSPDTKQLARLGKLLDLACGTGLYLDLTGLNCFRLERIPSWYDDLPEANRWSAQSRFWAEVARVCAGNSVVFCFDLMNEPVINTPGKGDHPWVGGELGGFHFVQRISNNPAGRDSKDIAEAWVKMLVASIREHDKETMVTVGVIPWAFVWPGAKPVFYSPRVARHLDFVSVHVYPKTGELDTAGSATTSATPRQSTKPVPSPREFLSPSFSSTGRGRGQRSRGLRRL